VFFENNTINGYLDEIYLNNGTKQQDACDKFAYDIQNYHCPILYTTQQYHGVAHTKEWEYAMFSSYYDIMYLKQVDWTWIYGPEDPDDDPTVIIVVVASISVVALVAIVYIYMKKRK